MDAHDDPPVLSSALLSSLQDRWRRYCPRLLTLLSPGLPAADIDAAIHRLGLRLPDEARRWWEWHDGVPAERVRYAAERACAGPGFAYLPLREAIQRYEMMRELAADLAADGAPGARTQDAWWDRSWFPVTVAANGRVIACDCGEVDADTTPIRAIKWGDDQEWHMVRARSFGEMVTWWIQGFDAGAYRYDADEHAWDYRFELLDAERELTRLV